LHYTPTLPFTINIDRQQRLTTVTVCPIQLDTHQSSCQNKLSIPFIKINKVTLLSYSNSISTKKKIKPSNKTTSQTPDLPTATTTKTTFVAILVSPNFIFFASKFLNFREKR